MKILNDYVYESLKIYGNTFITPKVYQAWGKDMILNDLKENGFNCSITEQNCAKAVDIYFKRKRDVIYILTVVKRNEDNGQEGSL